MKRPLQAGLCLLGLAALASTITASPVRAADCATLSALLKERSRMMDTVKGWKSNHSIYFEACFHLVAMEKNEIALVAEIHRVGAACKAPPRAEAVLTADLEELRSVKSKICGMGGHYENDLVR